MKCEDCADGLMQKRRVEDNFYQCTNAPACTFMVTETDFLASARSTQPSNMATVFPRSPVLCTACDNPLVKRSSVHGPFYGCSTFPRCRQVMSLSDHRLQVIDRAAAKLKAVK